MTRLNSVQLGSVTRSRQTLTRLTRLELGTAPLPAALNSTATLLSPERSPAEEEEKRKGKIFRVCSVGCREISCSKASGPFIDSWNGVSVRLTSPHLFARHGGSPQSPARDGSTRASPAVLLSARLFAACFSLSLLSLTFLWNIIECCRIR